MKKVFPIALTAIITSLVIISSCKKKDSNPVGNYTCHCSINTAGSITTVDLPFTNVTKSQATTSCASAQTTYTSSASSATCSIN